MSQTDPDILNEYNNSNSGQERLHLSYYLF
jgi:hypothetical protein